jgi:hypothetical protein
LQGANDEQVEGVATGELDKAKLDPKERALLDYVEVLTLRPAQISDALVEGLRKKAGRTRRSSRARSSRRFRVLQPHVGRVRPRLRAGRLAAAAAAAGAAAAPK